MNEIEKKRHHRTFEELKKATKNGMEFWFARELQPVLDYTSWNNFKRVINKAIQACNNSGQLIENHFYGVVKMVKIGSGAEREIEDYKLSRYACYLIVQNADSYKPVIANGQTYFAIQTRRQELADDTAFQQLKEDEKRIFLRNELKKHNRQLSEAAQQAGVETGRDFAIFHNHGYKGLYGGLDAKGIRQRKGLKKKQEILDYMGSTELAANLFRATQAEEKLRREKIQGKRKANKTHYEVGTKVRQTIKELGGTMPESLPSPNKGIGQLKRLKRQLETGGVQMVDRKQREAIEAAIEKWMSEVNLDSIDEVSAAIAQTNWCFDQEYWEEDTELVKISNKRCKFICKILMTGDHPRKNDAMFCGNKINVVIRGFVNLDKKTNAWEIDEVDKPVFSVSVEDWRDTTS